MPRWMLSSAQRVHTSAQCVLSSSPWPRPPLAGNGGRARACWRAPSSASAPSPSAHSRKCTWGTRARSGRRRTAGARRPARCGPSAWAAARRGAGNCHHWLNPWHMPTHGLLAASSCPPERPGWPAASHWGAQCAAHCQYSNRQYHFEILDSAVKAQIQQIWVGS